MNMYFIFSTHCIWSHQVNSPKCKSNMGDSKTSKSSQNTRKIMGMKLHGSLATTKWIKITFTPKQRQVSKYQVKLIGGGGQQSKKEKDSQERELKPWRNSEQNKDRKKDKLQLKTITQDITQEYTKPPKPYKNSNTMTLTWNAGVGHRGTVWGTSIYATFLLSWLNLASSSVSSNKDLWWRSRWMKTDSWGSQTISFNSYLPIIHSRDSLQRVMSECNVYRFCNCKTAVPIFCHHIYHDCFFGQRRDPYHYFLFPKYVDEHLSTWLA